MPNVASAALSPSARTVANPWPSCAKLPPGAAAVLGALHLDDPRTDALRRLGDRQWRDALEFCDRMRLTLYLRDTAPEAMPQWVRERTEKNAVYNLERRRRLEQLYRTVGGCLSDAGIPFLAIKGITHNSGFGGRPESRMQYDIDLFSSHEGVHAARNTLSAFGYVPVEGIDQSPSDHLPAMIRKTAWEWRGDYFDPEIPIPIELHFQFWNERMERLRAPGTGDFWNRRIRRTLAGIELGVLCPVDALGYAALHLLKHVLRGSAHPSHVYEIAGFLNSHTDDASFWNEWTRLHEPELRRLEAVVFRLAQDWFGCRLAPPVGDEIERLPAATHAWFAAFATAPARSWFDSNKDEIWLHGTLVASRRDAWSVARRRLLPGGLPLHARSTYVPETARTWSRHVRESLSYASHLASRILHHALALPRTAVSGVRWWWRTRGLR